MKSTKICGKRHGTHLFDRFITLNDKQNKFKRWMVDGKFYRNLTFAREAVCSNTILVSLWINNTCYEGKK